MRPNINRIISTVAVIFIVAAFTGCGTGQIQFRDLIGADIPTGGDDGGGIPGGGGTTPGAGKTLSVTGVYPPTDARGVVLNTHASLTFGVPMDPATIHGGTVKVYMLGGPVPNISVPLPDIFPSVGAPLALEGTVSYDAETMTATFSKDGEWRDCMRYQIVAASGEEGVKGMEGELLPADYASAFLSSCPQVYTYDYETAMDIGYAIEVAPDESGTPRMYVSGTAVGRDGGIPYLYNIFANRWDVSGSIGEPDWPQPFIQFGDWWNSPEPDAPQGAGMALDEDDNLITVGFERVAGRARGLFKKIDPSGASLVGEGVLLSEPVSISCRGLAHSPVAEYYAMTCANYRSGAVASYLFLLDNEGTLLARGAYGDLWSGQMFRNIVMDANGNAYVTLAPEDEFNTDGKLLILKFAAEDLVARDNPLEDPIPEPTVVAEHLENDSYGWDLALAGEGSDTVYYAAGSRFSGTRVGQYDAIVVKFNAAGEPVWEIKHGGPGANASADDAFTSIAIDPPYIYVAGFEGRELSDAMEPWDPVRRNMIMAKYRDNGATFDEVFFKSYEYTGYGIENSSGGHDIVIDRNAMNEIYVVGYIYEGAAGKNIAIWRSDNNGVGTSYCVREENFGPECIEAPDLCADGLDNDLNGLTDCADPVCFSHHPCEGERELTCDDGIDNDGDGFIDCDDSDCIHHHACGGSEDRCILGDIDACCSDGLDNDGDGLIDCDDPDCDAALNCQPEICDDGIDNDGDGLVDCDDGDCINEWYCAWACDPIGRYRCAAAADYCAMNPEECNTADYPDDACAARSDGNLICDAESGCCVDPCGVGWSCEIAEDMCSRKPSWCNCPGGDCAGLDADELCTASLWDVAACTAGGCCETLSGCNLSCAGAQASCDNIEDWCDDSFLDPCSAWWWGDELVCNAQTGCCEWDI